MTRVEAPSRLHFGLLSLPGGVERWPGVNGEPGLLMRQFGGIGLMIDKPGLSVHVDSAKKWTSTGPLAARALDVAQKFVRSLGQGESLAFQVAVQTAPPEHIGLGVGTQLALAVAKCIAVELGHADWPATELAKRVGRGERSAIGIHGFDRGGLIVEGGKLPDEVVSPLIGHYEFPSDWAVIVLAPPGGAKWHGDIEREALRRLPSTAEATGQLCRIALTGMLPALVSKNFDLFGEALYEFNSRVGDIFASVQGGRYASRATADCITRLRSLGVRGVGQSSWGPSVFAVVRHEDAEGIVRLVNDTPSIVATASSGAILA